MLLKYFLWNDGVCIDNEGRGSKRSLKGDNHWTLCFMKRKNQWLYLVSYYFKLFEAARLANLKRMAFLSRELDNYFWSWIIAFAWFVSFYGKAAKVH